VGSAHRPPVQATGPPGVISIDGEIDDAASRPTAGAAKGDELMLTPKRIAAVAAAVAAIGAFGPVAGAGAATTPSADWQSGVNAYQAGWQAGMAGWQAGADAARQGWEAGRAGWQAGANATVSAWQSWLAASQPTQVAPRQ
jgi:hypothetical protein